MREGTERRGKGTEKRGGERGKILKEGSGGREERERVREKGSGGRRRGGRGKSREDSWKGEGRAEEGGGERVRG